MIRKIILYFLMLFSISISVYAENIQGIDVSNWQGYIDFEEVKNSGIEIVYIKSSQGSNIIDSYFHTNYKRAKNAGLKIGIYHFLTATSVQEAINEANFFCSVIENTSPDCRLAMDFEIFNDLSIEEINEISLTFLEAVEKQTQKEMIIYSDAYNATNIFNKELAEKYPLWIAEYNSSSVDTGNWDSWVGYQYTDKGIVSGISGYVDKDLYTNAIFLTNTNNILTGQKNNQMFSEYIVKPGNTLSYIAKLFNTTVDELAGINGIKNPNLIYPNQIIKINTTLSYAEIMNDRYETNHIIYTIKYGDTLTSISRKYNVSIQSIVNLNDIKNPNLIYAGEKIRIDLN